MTPHMEVEVLEIAGVRPALLGLGLSWGVVDHIADCGKMVGAAKRLIGKGGGHDKFTESIQLWLDVKAPRYWWSQADTYRLSTKQSESTMHTLKHGVTVDDFEMDMGSEWRIQFNTLLGRDQLAEAKAMLPEGFLQRRIWNISLKTYINIRRQRLGHKLPHWRIFCDVVDNALKDHGIVGEIWETFIQKEQKKAENL